MRLKVSSPSTDLSSVTKTAKVFVVSPAAPLLEVDFGRTGLYAEYAARCGIRVTGGSEQIRAVVPGEAERANRSASS